MTRAEQERLLIEAVLANPTNAVLLASLNDATLPNWYLTAGCVCQTMWNRLTGRDPAYGICDYDVFYFESTDLSYEAEDAAIRGALDGIETGADVQIRNQARVHLWYQDHFGVPCAQFMSVEAGIGQFLTLSTAASVRRNSNGAFEVYAPDGLDDVFSLTVRPRFVPGRQHLYEAKAAAWRARWPELTILPWSLAVAENESKMQAGQRSLAR